MDGRISIHRKILDREWYDDINTKVLFIHLLLTVNIKDKQWRGKTIERGSRITSIAKLSKEIGLSIKQIRLSLDKLISTSEIDKQTTNEYTKLSITKYNDYQGKEGRERANERQTEGKQRATTKEDKNIITKENNIFEEFWKSYPHARKGKKQEALKYFNNLDSKIVLDELKLLLRKIDMGMENQKFIPACERWIRDFTVISQNIKEKILKDIVYLIMKIDGEKRIELANKFVLDFGQEIADKYRKEYNKENNSVVLKLK